MSNQTDRLNTALAGRYRIERELGAGGMATVYLAHDLKHGRDVALKVLRSELAQSLGHDRFLREIQLAAKLSHPHILPLYDSGDADGALFYVMPNIEGQSLRDRLRNERQLPIEEAVRITTEVAGALDHAHRHGVIHRDVKPENIMLQDGHALVADFGIGKAVGDAAADTLTQSGMSVGTPAYMSPEQAVGEAVDGRSDIYSLGCVLYEMIVGEQPFTGPTAQAVIAKRFVQTPLDIAALREGVPRPVARAVQKALARIPIDRYETAAHFVTSLGEIESARAISTAPEKSLAVLPFVNLSADPENEFFADGITEEILNALATIPDLRVAGRASAFSFKGKAQDLRAIGDKLNVRTVLEGSIRRSGRRVRINVQLSDVADGFRMWSERYDREIEDVFAVQDEIARVIAEKLKVTLGGQGERPLVKAATANLAAYDLYLKGRALELQRGPALLTAVECFEQAVALDPQYAAAHAELAKSLVLLSMWGMRSPAETHERAAVAARRALEADPSLVAAHTAHALFAFCAEHDREEASRAWARAVELDPTDVEARALRADYDLCYARGEYDEAIREIDIAIAADPLNVTARAHRSLILGFASRSDEAEAEARRAIEIGPRVFYAHWALVHALTFGPRPEAGIAPAMAMLATFGRHPWPMMGLAMASGMSGNLDTAEALYSELEARAHTEYVQPTVRALTAIGAKRHGDAFRHLRTAMETRDPFFALIAAHSPLLDSVRGAPEFVAILRAVGWDKPFAAVRGLTVPV